MVTAKHNNLDVDLTDVTVVDDAGITTTIETTPSHPFWAANVGRWVDAGDLSAGTVLLTADGTRVTVAVVRTFAGAKWMRDLTVNNVHTYYVVAGDSPVLVHNCGSGRSGGPRHSSGDTEPDSDYVGQHRAPRPGGRQASCAPTRGAPARDGERGVESYLAQDKFTDAIGRHTEGFLGKFEPIWWLVRGAAAVYGYVKGYWKMRPWG